MIAAGFLQRLIATCIDSIALFLLTLPLLLWWYGITFKEYIDFDQALLLGPADGILSIIAPGLLTVLFWRRFQTSPGKFALGLRIVDSESLGPVTTKQSILRYFGYFLSALPLFAGFFLMVFDKKKQALHDKIAGTLVLKTQKVKPSFDTVRSNAEQ